MNQAAERSQGIGLRGAESVHNSGVTLGDGSRRGRNVLPSPQSVLVPLDGSIGAESALEAVFRVGVRPAPLVLLHVRTQTGDFAVDGDQCHRLAPPPPLNGPEAYLSAVGAKFADRCDGWIGEVVCGDPRAEVLAAAKRFGSDLIAMTAASGGGSGKPSLSGLAGFTAGAANAAVLIAPRCTAGGCPRYASRVLVSLDGSMAAEAALAPALEVADRLASDLTLLEAVDARLFASAQGGKLGPEFNERLRDCLRDRASQYLGAVAERASAPTRRVSARVLDGIRHETVLRIADGDDVVVVAVPVRDGLVGWRQDLLVEGLASATSALLLLTPAMIGKADCGIR